MWSWRGSGRGDSCSGGGGGHDGGGVIVDLGTAVTSGDGGEDGVSGVRGFRRREGWRRSHTRYDPSRRENGADQRLCKAVGGMGNTAAVRWIVKARERESSRSTEER
ncbi:hypothetical protein Scep_027958 [Stephania cephalantha]|uniref:Uncharacterized protein n=1 Tax=Stephania cephalantha TaxID=152367 RepID=A0AAP0HLM0_9MAGN